MRARVDLPRRNALNDYDALGRLLTTTDAENITVINTYDADGNLVSVTDGKNQTTTFTYDGLNRNLTTTYGGTDTTMLVYDAMVQTARIDANGHRTDYAYDVRNRLKDVYYAGASGENRSYTYDGVGNILTVTENKAADTDVEYQYDALNRVVLETSSGVTHRYRYDLAGNRREAVYDLNGSHARTLVSTYDALNRTERITEGSRTTIYRYDLAGNIRETQQPNGDVIKCSYDSLGRKKVITGPGAMGSELYVTTNAYDMFGNLKQIEETYPAGNVAARTVTNTYDGVNRLVVEAVDWEAGGSDDTETTYTYDAAHNRIGKTVTVDGAFTSSITYSYSNALNQMESASDVISGAETDYSYDSNGNRVKSVANEVAGGKVTDYSYDRENRLIRLSEGGGEKRFIDIYPGTDDQEHADLAIQATYYESAPIVTYRYAYDYRTRRVLRDESAAGGKTAYVVFSGGTSVQEYEEDGTAFGLDGADTLQVEYVRGSDYGGGVGGILYSLRSDAPSFKHYNSRGDVVAATDGNSSLTYQASYEAFGRHGDTASSEEYIAVGTTLDRQRANTKDEDPTGLLNEGFRYRDLETGTFITRDPLGFVDGPNVYTYVVQNPWTKFDPLGLKFDDSTFDEENDRMKEWGDLDESVQEDISGQEWYQGLGDNADARQEAYNKRVGSFNDELDKLRATPFGSAQYEYLKNHEDTFKLEFGYGSDGKGSTRSFVNQGRPGQNQFYRIAGFDDFGTIAHEFMHLVQGANKTSGNIGRFSYQQRVAGPFGFVADRSDGGEMIIDEGGKPRPAFIEFQAQRARNIVKNEYDVYFSVDGLIQGSEPVPLGPNEWGMQRVQPTLEGLRNRGVTDYNNGRAGGGTYNFQNPSGSYQYPELFGN